jgi:hypothetical protein
MDEGMKIFTTVHLTIWSFSQLQALLGGREKINELMIIIHAAQEEERRHTKFYQGNILILKMSTSITETYIK